MKKFVSTLLVSSLLISGAFAKGTPPTKKRDFATLKKEKLAKLQAKKELIQKRINCIKKAKKRSDIRECEKKYPFVKRKSKKHTREMKKHKREHNKKEHKRRKNREGRE